MSEPACRCEGFNHPATVVNPPGRGSLLYRVGDYVTFRHALLLSRPEEIELVNWRPGAKGDLAVQMMEWWAVLADILTFYNERIANQDYLRTADLDESVTRLIKVLGYRPRPGIGARGTVAALLTGAKRVHLQPVFAIQSKPGPGKQPQIFEIDAASDLAAPDAIAADPAPDPALFAADGSILLQGAIALKPATPLLIVEKNWNGSNGHYALVTVTAAQPEKDPRGRPNTRLRLTTQQSGIPAGAHAAGYQVMRSAQAAHLWPFGVAAGLVVSGSTVHLDSLARSITAGQMVLFDGPSGWGAPSPKLVDVNTYSESIWFANPKSPSAPEGPPDLPPISIPHSVLTVSPSLTSGWDAFRSSVAVHHDWKSVGELIPSPATSLGVSTLTAVPPARFPLGNSQHVQIEDANGVGIAAVGTVAGDGTQMTLADFTAPPVPLKAPLRVLFDLLSVSRGKSVVNEILGSGDATQVNQDLVLAKSPLTYLLSGSSYKSTLRVWVDGLEWKEAQSFYGQPAGAQIFVTAEDESQKTHVKFGDGINGARLTSGLNNVVASYRYGSGKESPDAGSLTVILQPQPGLKSIRNPVIAGGGDDPDPAGKIRQFAPRSVLTFGRAVSGDDYQTLAAQTPGVARAHAYWGWDEGEQRTVVSVYVGDDDSARIAAQTALAAAADPNRPLRVFLATAVPIAVDLTLEIASNRVPADVKAAAIAALSDPDAGLLGLNAVQIGQSLFESQVYEACLSVGGVVAVHALIVRTDRGSGFAPESSFRYDPGEGGFFRLGTDDLNVFTQVVNGG